MTIANEITNYANGLSDAYGAVNDMGGVIPQDKNMNNLDTAIRTIPQNPGATYTAGNGINIDANNEISIDTTVVAEVADLPSNFTGATSSVAGSAGLVPAPTTSDPDKFLKGDGTWATPDIPDVKIIYTDSYISSMMAGDDFNMYPDSSYTTPYSYNEAHSILYSSAAVILQDQDSTRMLLSYDGEDFMTGFCYSANGYRLLLLDAVSGYTPGYNARVFFAYDLDYVMTGATASSGGLKGMVPAPAAGDQDKVLHGDGTWKDATAKLVEMAYGESNAWAKFIAAYNAGSIVYCRASSNANPATGSQTRKAFMAYVNNAATPTSVEFQYVRSVGSKTASQPVDQVFVYTLTNANGGTWNVQTRDMAPKIAAGTGISVSYNNGTYTISLA